MYTLLVFLPLFGFIFSFFLGSYLGYFSVYLNTLCIFLSLALSLLICYECTANHFLSYVKLGNWFYVLEYGFNFDLIFDELSSIMLFIVLFISFFVHLFSISYMKGDANYNKFFSYLTLFTFFMIVLVLSTNFIQFFLGWEGIGLLSYLLINFWSTRLEANRSAIKAILLNKIGDCFFYVFIVLFFLLFNTFDFIFPQTLALNYIDINLDFFHFYLQDFLVFFLIVAAAAKSAQIGLHIWLPDAMEGPTPVSALLHAATMVTAGIYLLLRCSWLLDLSSFSLVFLLIIGIFTNFFTSLVAIFQKDLKKIIAYSTASQLGFMFISIGLSSYNAAFFHLFNHAFFKALLFLCAGVIIHQYNSIQDLRFLNSLIFYAPLTYICFLIGQLCLIGLPYLSAYYSKDLIIQLVVVENNFIYYFLFWFINISIVLTAFYSIRVFSIIFWNNFYEIMRVIIKFDRDGAGVMIYNKNLNLKVSQPNNFNLTLFFLAVFSIVGGYLFFDIFNNYINYYFKEVFFFSMYKNYFPILDFIEYSNLFILFCGFMGAFLGYNLDFFIQKFLLFFNINVYYFFYMLNKKWFFDSLYTYFSLYFLNFMYLYIYKIIDKGFFEFFTSLGFIRFFKFSSNYLVTLQSGYLFYYFFIILLFFLSFFIFFYLSQFVYIYVCILLLEYNDQKSNSKIF